MSRRKRRRKSPPSSGCAGSAVADVEKEQTEAPLPEATETEDDPATDDVTEEAPVEAAAAEVAPDADRLEDEGPSEDTAELELDAQDLSRQLTRLETENEEIRDLVRRKQAEFENYRKRVERERSDMSEHASAEVVRDVLPVLDNLERAIAASEVGSEGQFREGVEIIYRQFRDILEKQGLRQLVALQQPFDPHVHEAVGRVETLEHPEGTVLEVLQPGYMFKDRLLRPAMVSVAQTLVESGEVESLEETEASSEPKDIEENGEE